MTATAHTTAPSLEQLAPHVASRVKAGDLKTAQLALLGVGIALLEIGRASCRERV